MSWRKNGRFGSAWLTYVQRLPAAAPRIMLGDFSLFRISLATVRYVGGFAQAGTIPLDRLASAAGERDT